MDTLFNKNEILVGSHVKKDVSDHLSLAALVQNESRSQILRNLILDYLNTQASSDKLIESVAKNIISIYEKQHKNKQSLEQYLSEKIIPVLEKKTISTEHMNKIIKKVEEAFNAENKKTLKRTK